jgi:hypothetical protein
MGDAVVQLPCQHCLRVGANGFSEAWRLFSLFERRRRSKKWQLPQDWQAKEPKAHLSLRET